MFNGKLNQFCKETNNAIHKSGLGDERIKSLNIISTDEKLSKSVDDAFISQKIYLIVSKLSEAVDAMKVNNYGLEKKDSFEDKIADTIIRIADLCGELDIDIEKQIAWKLNYNLSCGHKFSGKAF